MTATPGPTSRWGAQTSLVQPRQPAFWLFVVLLGIGGYLFFDEQTAMSALPQAYALSWLLMACYALPVALIIYRLDLFEREPRSLLLAALLWGGVIATALAGDANGAWLSVLGKLAPAIARDWGPAIVGPGVEETLKLLGVVTVFLIARAEFDDVLDGFVYGAMVGLGFTIVEDVLYFMNAAAAATGLPDQPGPVVDTFVIRVVAGGLYSHVLFTGLTGMGFAYFVTRHEVRFNRRLAVCLAGIAAGVAAHAVWNSPWMSSILDSPDGAPSPVQWIALGTVKGLPFLLLLGLLVVLATRTEDAKFAAIVAGEVGDEVITPAELAALRNLMSRRAARKAAGRTRGRAAERLVGRLQAAQVGLGMALSKAGSPNAPEVEARRSAIRAIRAELAALPAIAAPANPAPASVAASTGPLWSPTHVVPPGGLPSWPSPDPALQPSVVLAERLELVVEESAGAWAHVRAVNGWRGWVDGRRLLPRPPA